MSFVGKTTGRAIGSRLLRLHRPIAISSTAAARRALSSKDSPFEEERCPSYSPRHYYPAHIGETLNDKYRLLSKLGWGSESTVWLAKDTTQCPSELSSYVALKITNSSKVVRKAAHAEWKISEHISSIKTSHPGRKYVRLVLDAFDIQGPEGPHLCLAFEPLRQPLWMLGEQISSSGLVPPRIIKTVMPMILNGLDFLHSECQVIHTDFVQDLKGDNLMIPFEDPSVLEHYVQEQEAHPAPSIERDGRMIYESRRDFGRMQDKFSKIKISDFGLSVHNKENRTHRHVVQPLAFAAPEVVLKAGWTYPVDIWSLGLVLWELLEEVTYLDGKTSTRSPFSQELRFAQMIRLFGPPPAELLARADPGTRDRFFNDRGEFKHTGLIPGDEFSFDALTPVLEGEERKLFIEFARRMLKWVPEERASAKELLEDPWLKH